MPRSGRNRRFAILSDETSLVDISSDGTLLRSEGSKGTMANPHKLSPAATGKSTNKLQSLFNPFTKTQDKMDQLTELLNTYSAHGLPPLPDWITRGRLHYDSNTLYLERHWSDIVAFHEKMNKRQRDQQEALWELLTTEVEYIRKIKVIIDLFYCCLVNLQANQLLNEINLDMVFSNVCDVFYATCHFWVVHMSQVLKRSRETKEPLDPCLLKSGFQVFDKLFEPYIKYCLDLEYCRDYLKCKIKDNDLFRTFIMWAEGQTQCSRLSLVDLIAKPFQRITKYSLLLFAIKKPLEKMETNGDVDQQKRDISKMVQQVEKFVLQVNKAMRQRHEHMQLSVLMDKIDSYEAVEVPSDECLKMTEQFCKFDLSMPMPGCGESEKRNLLFEGGLKFKDNYTKTDVYCFLFTDMLLITKPTGKRGDKVKVFKPPMRLDKIVVQSMRDVASFMVLYLNEYGMAQAVYTLHGDSKVWVAHLTKAQRDFQERRHNFESQKSRDHDRGGSCDAGLLLRESQDPYRFPRDTDLDGPSAIQYRSQLSVPSLFGSEASGEVFDRKISSERIKRKVLNNSISEKGQDSLDDTAKEGGSTNRLSSSSYDLHNTQENSTATAIRSKMSSKRPSISHHRRHSSDPIRDLESLTTALLSSSFPGASEGDATDPVKLNWNLGESHTETDADTPSSGKNSDSSNLNLESGGSKTSLNVNPLKPISSEVEIVVPDKSSSEPDFASKFQTYSEEIIGPLEGATIPMLTLRQPSICNALAPTTSKESNSTATLACQDTEPNASRSQALSKGDQRDGEAALVNTTPVESSTEKSDDTISEVEAIPGTKDSLMTPKSTEGSSEETDSEPLQSCEDEFNPDLVDNKTRKTSTSEASESNRDEEFHMCYLPEEYSSLPSPPRSTTNEFPPWSKAPLQRKTVVFLEASTQTPLEFLIAGYFDLTSSPDLRSQCTYRSASRSLPNIFEFKPCSELSVPLLCSKEMTAEKRAISVPMSSLFQASTQSKVH